MASPSRAGVLQCVINALMQVKDLNRVTSSGVPATEQLKDQYAQRPAVR